MVCGVVDGGGDCGGVFVFVGGGVVDCVDFVVVGIDYGVGVGG